MLGRYALGRHAIGRTPEEGSYAVNAEAGSFVWTGQDADGYTLILTAEAGSFTWAGQASDLLVQYAFEAEAGAFIWTGMDADRGQTRGILRARGSATPFLNLASSGGGSSATPFLNLASSGGGRINMRGGRTC